MTPLISVCIPTYDDFTGLWATLVSLNQQLGEADALDRVEIVVCDNHPALNGEHTRRLVEQFAGRYVPLDSPTGTAPPRNAAIAAATGEHILMIDSHVLLRPGVMARLLDFAGTNTTDDLFYGPCLKSAAHQAGKSGEQLVWTHWLPEWGRDGLFGRAVVDDRGRDPEAPPFTIQHSGTGLFMTRRAAWPGYPAAFRGFGLEGHMTGTYAALGRSVWCLPWLRWQHCFTPHLKKPYPMQFADRARNYIIMATSGNPLIRLEDVHEHMVQNGRLSSAQWNKLLAQVTAGEAEQPSEDPQVDQGLPGTELLRLIDELGIKMPSKCECVRRARQMDEWGIAGCVANREIIVGWLRDSVAKAGWAARITGAGMAVWTGVAWRIDPRDPIPGLVAEAIRRAHRKRQLSPTESAA